MNNQKYILGKNHELIEADLMTWARFFEDKDNRRVALDVIGDSQISTVFLGCDHNWGEGEPLLFETMIFGGKRGGEQWRWHTWQEAEEGHKKIVEELKQSIMSKRTRKQFKREAMKRHYKKNKEELEKQLVIARLKMQDPKKKISIG